MLENHYPQPAVFWTVGRPEGRPALHHPDLAFRTAPPDGCPAARRSEDAARGL